MTDDEIREHVEEAKTIVRALAAAQVGDHHAIAQAETFDQIDKLEDVQLRYTVLRMFSAVVAAFATSFAEDCGKQPGTDEWESVAIEAIRIGLDNIDWTAHNLDGDG